MTPIVKLFSLCMFQPRPGTFDHVGWMAEMERLYELLDHADEPTALAIFAFAGSAPKHKQ